jgi:2-polyprenyl-6-methoxyphenol hydroxylase-like FAD-dependent oxidoreductase
MHHPTVLISGAGIAGTTLAFLLAEKGFYPTVIERSRGLRSSGTPIDVQGSAFDVAQKMGIVPKLREAATRVSSIVFLNRTGRRTVMSLPVNNARQIELPRHDLARILHEAAQSGVDFLFNDSVVAVHEDGDRVNVAFETSPPRHFDYLIGCDGLHSTVRHLVFGPEEMFVLNLGLYVATFPLEQAAANSAQVVQYNMPNRAIAIHPARGNAIVALMYRAPIVTNFDYLNLAQHRDLLNDTFRDAAWPGPELLDRLNAVEDFYFDSVSRVRLECWSKGRVALLGDAASCVSFLGGGSSNAMAGAAALTESLSAAPDDPEVAFRHYERTHRNLIDPKQRRLGLASHFLIPSTSAGIRTRDLAIRLWSFISAQ